MQNALATLEWISSQVPALVETKKEVGEWTAYLDKKYQDGGGFFATTMLDFGDAQKLQKDSEKWIAALLAAYGNRGTVMVNEENIDRLFTDQLKAKLSPATRADLDDGIITMLHLIPTPAAMTLLRVAENVVRAYYTKITGKQAERKDWNEILDELRARSDVKKPLLGYLDYIRDKRNEGMHPDKRYSQEESEAILLQVKKLIEEVEL